MLLCYVLACYFRCSVSLEGSIARAASLPRGRCTSSTDNKYVFFGLGHGEHAVMFSDEHAVMFGG